MINTATGVFAKTGAEVSDGDIIVGRCDEGGEVGVVGFRENGWYVARNTPELDLPSRRWRLTNFFEDITIIGNIRDPGMAEKESFRDFYDRVRLNSQPAR